MTIITLRSNSVHSQTQCEKTRISEDTDYNGPSCFALSHVHTVINKTTSERMGEGEEKKKKKSKKSHALQNGCLLVFKCLIRPHPHKRHEKVTGNKNISEHQ